MFRTTVKVWEAVPWKSARDRVRGRVTRARELPRAWVRTFRSVSTHPLLAAAENAHAYPTTECIPSDSRPRDCRGSSWTTGRAL
jgi:hypothetical protein